MNALDKSDLETGVLPQILLGLRDTHEDLVALSLEALAHLVPILGATIVVGKERQNLFKDGTPGRVILSFCTIIR